MATPKGVTDGSAASAYEESVINRFLLSDGAAIQVKVWHARIRYNGSAQVVEPAYDSAGFTTGALAFDAGNTEFDITLSGFTNPPIAILTPVGGATVYYPKVIATTNVLLSVAFFDVDTGAKIGTGSLDSDMDFNCILIGF